MKRRMFLAGLFVSAVAALSAPVDATVISVNFVGGRPVSGGGSVTTTAGVVPVGNWNNAAGASGGPVAVVNSAGAASGTMSWTSPNTWSATDPAPPGGGNATMMSGYLDNFGGNTISVSGLDSTYTTLGYSVLVYFHEDSAGAHGASIADNLGNTDVAFAFQSGGGGSGYPLAGPDGFIVSTSTASNTTSVSNVILLEGLKGSSFTITGVNGTTGDNRTRPNAFQIVANVIPEPSSLALLGCASLAMLRRRRTA